MSYKSRFNRDVSYGNKATVCHCSPVTFLPRTRLVHDISIALTLPIDTYIEQTIMADLFLLTDKSPSSYPICKSNGSTYIHEDALRYNFYNCHIQVYKHAFCTFGFLYILKSLAVGPAHRTYI
jgi:hypothetical protein